MKVYVVSANDVILGTYNKLEEAEAKFIEEFKKYDSSVDYDDISLEDAVKMQYAHFTIIVSFVFGIYHDIVLKITEQGFEEEI